MIFRTRSRWVTAIVLAFAAAGIHAPANVVWSGLGGNNNWTTPANWEGGSAPANDGSEQIVFASSPRTTVLVDASQSIRRLRFDFSSADLSYSLYGGNAATLTLGADGIEVRSGSSSSGVVTFDTSLRLLLSQPQSWSVDAGSALHVASALSGTGPLTLTGDGYTGLSGNNTYTGGTVLERGALGLDHDNALGTGPLTVSGSASLYSNSGVRTIANALTFRGSLLDLLPYGGEFHFTGPVTLGANVTMRGAGHPVYFEGTMGETGGSRTLTVSGPDSILVLSGNNTYSGGTAVLGGYVFFSQLGAVPANGALSSSTTGYIGTGFGTSIQSGFISRFSGANTLGTIGFDTAPNATSAALFTEAVDLSAFNASARLGTATRATFAPTAVITPPILGGYRFGDGGGTFTLESKLTGANSLTVDSSATGVPLTLMVTNPGNDYAGLTTVTDSALIFGPAAVSSNAAPASFVLGSGGYIGSSDTALTLATWLGQFSPLAVGGVIGFDSVDVNNPRTVSGTFNLTPFLSATSLALGTTSAAILSGSIALPPLQSDYLFTGYKGGALSVDAVLSGARGVRIGSASGDYPDFDPTDSARMSTVALNGGNSHSAGTTLYNGRLVLGHAAALGNGALTIDGSGATANPRLETSLNSNPTFASPLVVKAGLDIGGANAFAWSGDIANGVTTGRIRKDGISNVTLSGNNSAFSGGFQVNEGTLTFASDTAAGTGRLDLGVSNGVAAFTTTAPSINGLSGQSNTARVTLASGTTLLVNQTSSSTYRGRIEGAGGIVKTGAGTLKLQTAGTFTGGTTINAGTLNVASTGALGAGSVTLNGATSTLNVESAVTLANSLFFGASGGRLTGSGAFSSSVVVGTNSVIAPGNSVGTLTFTNGLTLAPGGSYDFEVQNATGGPGVGWDYVSISGPLTFTATPTAPFSLNLISLSSSGNRGNVSNFQADTAYAWAIASATSFVNFNPGALVLNTENFTSALNGGTFSFTTSGNDLLLNFTPVPEPSTWAMLLAGLGLIGYRKLRHRR